MISSLFHEKHLHCLKFQFNIIPKTKPYIDVSLNFSRPIHLFLFSEIHLGENIKEDVIIVSQDENYNWLLGDHGFKTCHQRFCILTLQKNAEMLIE